MSFAKEAWPFVLPLAARSRSRSSSSSAARAAIAVAVVGLLVLLFFRDPRRALRRPDRRGPRARRRHGDRGRGGRGSRDRPGPLPPDRDLSLGLRRPRPALPGRGRGGLSRALLRGQKLAAFRADVGDKNERYTNVFAAPERRPHRRAPARRPARPAGRLVPRHAAIAASAASCMGVIKFGSRVDLYVPATYECWSTRAIGSATARPRWPSDRRRRGCRGRVTPAQAETTPRARPRRADAAALSCCRAPSRSATSSSASSPSILALRGRFVCAAVCILVAGVVDNLDGRIARLTGTESDFGTRVRLARRRDHLRRRAGPGRPPLGPRRSGAALGWLVPLFFVVCCATRLARFNVQTVRADKRFFVGLPCPAAAGGIACFLLVAPHAEAASLAARRHGRCAGAPRQRSWSRRFATGASSRSTSGEPHSYRVALPARGDDPAARLLSGGLPAGPGGGLRALRSVALARRAAPAGSSGRSAAQLAVEASRHVSRDRARAPVDAARQGGRADGWRSAPICAPTSRLLALDEARSARSPRGSTAPLSSPGSRRTASTASTSRSSAARSSATGRRSPCCRPGGRASSPRTARRPRTDGRPSPASRSSPGSARTVCSPRRRPPSG